MTLQDIIHYFEVGAGRRFLRFLLPCILVLAIAILYDFRAWKNMSAPAAMDAAQVARNIAQGKGFSTDSVRPLSIYLVQNRTQARGTAAMVGGVPDYAQLETAHPDLANPPVYPLLLAGVMKIAPFHYDINLKSIFWANNGTFARYEPDFLITIFNELVFLAGIAAAFFIARKLFDTSIARLSAVLILGCNILWHFSASDLSTMVLMLEFLGLIWCVMKVEELGRELKPHTSSIYWWSAAAGLVTGLGALTRYGFGWTIIPVALFLALFGGPKKFSNVGLALAAFVIALGPWMARNAIISGAPFGTAGYALFDGNGLSQYPLERSLHPDSFESLWPALYWHKFVVNAIPILENDILKIGGTWPSLLFFAGLMLGFNRPAARRIRYFILMCLAVFIVVQCLGKTSIANVSPEINSENLLVLAAPMVIIFGVAFFYILLDQMKFPLRQLRYLVIGIFIFLSCLPLLSALWYKTSPVSFPPYYPPDIARCSAWMKPNEMMMSDVPWAVAWYGNRQCVWLTDAVGTGDDQDSFFEVNDEYIKPVSALYLTMRTMDDRLLTDCLRSGKNSWGTFVLNALAKEQIPPNFPLRHAPSGSAAVASGIFLTDLERWKFAAAH